jgi:hypothetical protein
MPARVASPSVAPPLWPAETFILLSPWRQKHPSGWAARLSSVVLGCPRLAPSAVARVSHGSTAVSDASGIPRGLTALSAAIVIRDLVARDPAPRTRSRKLAAEALAIEADEAQQAGALGFMARVLFQTTLPHSRPAADTFLRRNGRLDSLRLGPPPLGTGSTPLRWTPSQASRHSSSIHFRVSPRLPRK